MIGAPTLIMRTPYAVTFMLALIVGGTYLFTSVQAGCNVPLAYRIGSIDPQFDLSFEEARLALVDAEAVWENATGQNLFTYDETAEYTVNFIFDDRQALTEAERTLRERLDASENANETIDERYAKLVAEYNELDIIYKTRVEAYERDLGAYNREVEGYNREGGAPPAVYEELEERKEALDREQRALNNVADQLNALVGEINRLGEEGNRLIDMHNRQVETYNRTFGHEREFTQGDYQDKTINIYTFVDRTELALVLAHELGHAIALDHVENEESIMYYLMGGQPDTLVPSVEDLEHFEMKCGDRTMAERVTDRYTQFTSWLKSDVL